MVESHDIRPYAPIQAITGSCMKARPKGQHGSKLQRFYKLVKQCKFTVSSAVFSRVNACRLFSLRFRSVQQRSKTSGNEIYSFFIIVYINSQAGVFVLKGSGFLKLRGFWSWNFATAAVCATEKKELKALFWFIVIYDIIILSSVYYYKSLSPEY